jgi:hypothetical protein
MDSESDNDSTMGLWQLTVHMALRMKQSLQNRFLSQNHRKSRSAGPVALPS